MAEKMIEKGKEVVTNENGFGVELKLKFFKVQLSGIGVVVCANKMAHSWVEKSYLLHMNLWIMSHLGNGDLYYKV